MSGLGYERSPCDCQSAWRSNETHWTTLPNNQLAVSVKSAAAMYELSETTIREAIDSEALPAYRVGRAIRLQVDDLREWFAGLTRVGSEDDQ